MSQSRALTYENRSKTKNQNKREEPEGRYLFSQKTLDRQKQNQKRMGYYGTNEAGRQRFRKREFKVSNPLGNYYFPKIHKRSWWPNGVYTIKRRYNETEIGLEHFYEKNNVEQLKDTPLKGEKKKDRDFLQEFKEYEDLSNGKYVITIEYCASCDEHANITQHSDEVFKNLAVDYQKIIQERFPFIQVLLKPIDVDIIKTEGFKLPELPPNGQSYGKFPLVNDQFKQCRIGAFEIQICSTNNNGEKDVKIIHSKLKSKTFPKVNQVLDKIVSFMPKFSLELVLFDKEDYDDIEKMNDIQVNIYYYKSEIIKEISDEAEMEILNFTNPKDRLENMKRQRLLNKETTLRNDNFGNNTQRFSATSTSFRPQTTNNIRTKTQMSNTMYNTTNGFNVDNDMIKRKGKIIQRRFSKVEEQKIEEKKEEKQIQKSNVDDDEDNDIEDDRSESVLVTFNPLPYDTYLIETLENSNFSPSITLLKFNSLPPDVKEVNIVKKYIGLMHQTRSIFQIHVYMEEKKLVPKENGNGENQNNDGNNNNDNGNDFVEEIDQIPITTANITICDIQNPNSKYQIKLNSQNIYEYKTEPGEYKVVIQNKDCETLQMKVKLEKGLNEKNFKLQPQKACELTLIVKEYYEKDEEETEEGTNLENQDNEKEEGFSIIPVRNAEVQIIKNPDILLIEGITNRKGLMNYEIGKDDNNLSIIVTKFGYFPSQRTFNRNEDIKVNENGKYEMNMSLILIKQSLLSKNHKVLLVSYANTYKQLFDFICINEDEKNNKITPYDSQNKEGTFICSFSCTKKDNEAESEEQNEEKIEKEEKKENEEDEEDQPKVPQNASNEEFNEETFYEEIIRVGFKISAKSIQTNPEEENKENNENLKEMTVLDIIEYLRKVCCQVIVYTPSTTFSINLPKVLNRNNEEEDFNEKKRKSKRKKDNIKKNNNATEPSEGLYWDLGWVDAKNTLFYETSIFHDFNVDIGRTLYFEQFIDFLQIFIDKKIYDSLFEYFDFNHSVLTGSDRYLPKTIFVNKCNQMLTDKNEDENNDYHTEEYKKKLEENKKLREQFIEFLSNIMCGFDDENNILDDSISLYLLKKKISSNLRNFEDNRDDESG